MKKNLIHLAVFTVSTSLSTSAICGSFPHTSAIYQTVMSGPMMKVITDAYVKFDKDPTKTISAEWVTQETPMGKTKKLNITQKGIVYAVDLDREHCTRTNIKSFTDSISDPEALAKSMKQSMNLKESGSCEVAGLKGTKLTSSFAEMCMYKDVFMLSMTSMGSKTELTKVEFDVDLPKDKVTLPAGLNCVEGLDFSKGIQGLKIPEDSSRDSMPERKQQPPQNMEEAMKKAQEAMKSFGGMGGMFDKQ